MLKFFGAIPVSRDLPLRRGFIGASQADADATRGGAVALSEDAMIAAEDAAVLAENPGADVDFQVFAAARSLKAGRDRAALVACYGQTIVHEAEVGLAAAAGALFAA